jgi:hypothetical protein
MLESQAWILVMVALALSWGFSSECRLCYCCMLSVDVSLLSILLIAILTIIISKSQPFRVCRITGDPHQLRSTSQRH